MLPALIIIAVALLAVLWFVRQVTVFEFERGVRYDRGRFSGVLGPGSYWIVPRWTRIVKLDARPTNLVVPGQEVVAADGVGLKITLAAVYEVEDPARAMHAIASYATGTYTELQLALREVVAGAASEELLAARAEIGRKVSERCTPACAAFGIRLLSAEVKDIMFPGDLKKVFSQVVRARQEGLAALERARGETAALRNLANAAALVEKRPALMQLRLLQALGGDGGNTVVLSLAPGGEVLPVATRGAGKGGPSTKGGEDGA